MSKPLSQMTGRVLVVDDDDNSRHVLARLMEKAGFTVETAADGPSAIAMVERTEIDLILLDVEMPGMTGFAVLRHLRLTHPATHLPVIIATARGERDDIIEGLGLGANDYVTKPLDFLVVMARVKTHLSHKRATDRIRLLELDLRRQNLELEAANQRMRHSLAIAARMQKSLLPAEPVQTPGVRFSWIFEPCDELGGDILNVVRLGGEHVLMYLLDVSGHGVPAALLSVTLSRLLTVVPGQTMLVATQAADGLEPRSPRDVVQDLNTRFQMSESDIQYFTLFYGVLNVRRRTMTYISAGHPPALLLSRGGCPEFLQSHNVAVGWFAETEFEERTIQLQESDRLFIYSDGCLETANPSKDQFGSDRLIEAVSSHPDSVDDALHALLSEMTLFRGEAPALDDVSALAVEISGR